MSSSIIYTIGHSTHSHAYFLELLQTHQITALVDVRSIPASRFNPQYNLSPLSSFLCKNDINYLHFAQSFGARQISPQCLNDRGQVDFEKVRKTLHFQQGIDRLKLGLDKGHNIAIMCAESEPCQCHRFGMICPALIDNDIEIRHILKDKTCLPNQEIEQKILEKYSPQKVNAPLFPPIPYEERLKHAYAQLNKEIGYVHKP